jgi:hypothetical protein
MVTGHTRVSEMSDETEDQQNQKSYDSILNEKPDENIFLKYNLDTLDRQIIRLLITNPGVSNLDIAKMIGQSEHMVNWRRKRETFKKAYSEQLMTAPELFQKAQELAIRKLIYFIQGKNEKLAFEASKIFAFPLMQAQALALSPKTEETIVFRTRIGPAGEVIRQKSVDGKEEKEDVIVIEAENDNN